MDCILAIDIGTQSLRAGIIDKELTLIELQKVSYSPQVISRDKVEMDPEVLWNALIQACRLLRQKERIGAIVLSSLCPSLLPMDAAGNALHPIILHLDRRSFKQAIWALKKVGEKKIMGIAGNLPIPGGISVTSLLWLKDNEAGIYNRKDVCFGHAVTFILKRLTDQFVIDPSNASFTGLFNTVGFGDWDEGLLRSLEIERKKLPNVILSTEIGGELGNKTAQILGLRKNIPCVIGANDTTCAAVGAGAITPGALMNTSGTVEILVLCLDKPIISKDHLLRTHAYQGKWLAMKVVGAGGASLEWFRTTFCKELERDTFYNEYLKKVLSSCKIPETRFQPFLAGDRHRVKRKSASYTRLSLSTTREDLLLSLVHGIVTFQSNVIEQWMKYTKLDKQIAHVGGGAHSAYTEYKEKMIKDFKFIQMGETTLTGAARLAIEALG